MTALPLFWGEGDAKAILQGKDQRAAVITRISETRTVLPIDTLNDAALAKVSLLIIAQPRNVFAAELSALDRWTHAGGKLIVFADPMLTWPTKLHLGDPRRAPPTSTLDSLFNHWGLSLARKLLVTNAIEKQTIFGRVAAVVTSGVWQIRNPECSLASDAFIAECNIGRGKAIFVADADILNQLLWTESGMANDAAIIGLIERLESKQLDDFQSQKEHSLNK